MAKPKGNQKKLDVNKDGKISKEDFAMLRKKKGKGKMAKHTKKMSKGGAKKKMMYGGAMGKKKTKKMSKGGPVRRR